MAKVYSLPKEFKVPVPNYKNYDYKKEQAIEDEFVKNVQGWAVEQNPTDKYAGVEYYIQMGDGYARYVVLSSKPVKLIHLPIGDAWDSPWAGKVTKKDIIEFIEREQALKKIFG